MSSGETRYPRTIHHPCGYRTVTVKDADEERRVRSSFSAIPALEATQKADAPTETPRRGRRANVRNRQ